MNGWKAIVCPYNAMLCNNDNKKRYEHTKPEWLLKIWGVEEDRHIPALTRWYFFALPLNDIYFNPSLCLSSIRNISINLRWVETCLLASFSPTPALSRVFLQQYWSPIFCEALDKSTSFSGHMGSSFSSSISPGMKKWQKSRRSCSCI